MGSNRAQLKPSSASCLLENFPVQQAIRPTNVQHLDLLTGSVELANTDLSLCDVAGRELTLKHLLQRVRQRYEIILLDCPPNMSLIGVNALVAADGMIVPVTPQHLAIDGLISLLASAETIRVRLGTRGRLLGILLTMVDASRSGPLELRERLRAQYRDHVFHTEITSSRALEEAPGAFQTIFQFSPRSRAADAFRRLSGEVLERSRMLRH